LGLFFYNIFLVLFKASVRIAALFNPKAKKWVQGRKGIWEKLGSEIGSQKSEAGGQKPEEAHSKIIWVHCASLGEFEQGRPVIERLKSQYPGSKLLLTFFSPSGYEIRKDYKGADWVFYLPMDGSQNAKRFLEIVNPALVIFVKYEFWYYYLREIKHNNTPLILISALFREHSVFFKWYGGLQRKMLSFFDHLFVQNETSKRLLNSIGLDNKSSVCGDTRFDRVIEIAEKFIGIPAVEEFVGNSKTIVAGSTWPEDEQVLQRTIETINDPSLKLIIAPHEINKEHIANLQKLFPGVILYSQLQTSNIKPVIARNEAKTSNLLIIDNIGMLSRLYKYGFITYIGGGFGKGIHNTLEAAVYGKPVLFGPAYRKFNEAIDLVNNGGAISINNTDDCIVAIKELIRDDSAYTRSSEKSKDYVYTNKGATEKIMKFIQEKRLLTN
jgi:3-deoxy-D-manno-octulosonic-acid transferase